MQLTRNTLVPIAIGILAVAAARADAAPLVQAGGASPGAVLRCFLPPAGGMACSTSLTAASTACGYRRSRSLSARSSASGGSPPSAAASAASNSRASASAAPPEGGGGARAGRVSEGRSWGLVGSSSGQQETAQAQRSS